MKLEKLLLLPLTRKLYNPQLLLYLTPTTMTTIITSQVVLIWRASYKPTGLFSHFLLAFKR
jgi:hypothetical protein